MINIKCLEQYIKYDKSAEAIFYGGLALILIATGLLRWILYITVAEIIIIYVISAIIVLIVSAYLEHRASESLIKAFSILEGDRAK